MEFFGGLIQRVSTVVRIHGILSLSVCSEFATLKFGHKRPLHCFYAKRACKFGQETLSATANYPDMETNNTEAITLEANNLEPEPLTLEAVFEEKIFEATSLRQPHWMKDGQRFSYLDNAPGTETTTLWMYDVRSGERTPLIAPDALKLPPHTPRPAEGAEADGEAGEEAEATEAGDGKPDTFAIREYTWSPDETRLLFAHTPKRRAAQGDVDVYIYTLATKKLERVLHSKKTYRNVKWSPDGHKLGYVFQDDIYVRDLATGHTTRLTDTATPTRYNGRFGWVYEEELDLADGWSWSPDGRQIAYFQIDETHVPQINLPNYDDLHMKPVETRYPKAGDPNPGVKIGLLTLPTTSGTEHAVPPTHWVDLGPDTDIYVAVMQWTPHGDLLLQRLPRLQNRIDLLHVNPKTGKTTLVLTEEDKAWVEVRGDVTFVGETDQFLWPSDRDGHTHLYLYDLSGNRLRQVTTGAWDVEKIAGVDAAHRLVYFTAANPSPMERHLFSALLDGGGDITRLTDAPGTHQALFAPDGQHYLNTHSARGSAPHVRLHRASGQHVTDVHANPMPKLQNRRLQEWEFTTFQTADGTTLNAALLKPADFDPNKKYPVLMHTYGGPGSQTVLDRWGNGGGLEQYLAQKGYLFAMIEGRGSGFRGRDFMKVTYQNLGHYEVNDQIEGAKWLAGLPFVDGGRIGIWGWSYGGYMACLCILRGADVFKTAMAVAPVTHWAFYDSIYTERYMRRPQDNPKGYEESSPITYADRLKGKFLLVHGTADDNVHFQNSARLAEAFQQKGKPFRAMYYPGKHHGLEGVALHWSTLLTDFITETL